MSFRFVKLIIAGIGPFEHGQELLFGDKVTLITGDNASGKTTLVNAMKYGMAPTRYARPRAALHGGKRYVPEASLEIRWDTSGMEPSKAANLVFAELDSLQDRFPKIRDEFSLGDTRIPFPTAFREFSRYSRVEKLNGDWEFTLGGKDSSTPCQLAFHLTGDDAEFSSTIFNAGYGEVSMLYLGMFTGIRSHLGLEAIPLLLAESCGGLDELYRVLLRKWLWQLQSQVIIIDSNIAWRSEDVLECTRYKLELARDGASQIRRVV